MNSSYRTNHRQVKEKQESLGTEAVLSEDRGRGCSRMGPTSQGLRLAEVVSSSWNFCPNPKQNFTEGVSVCAKFVSSSSSSF